MKGSKTDQIKTHLISFGTIDRTTAVVKYKCFDLPDVIKKLRRSGVSIQTISGYEPDTKYQLVNT